MRGNRSISTSTTSTMFRAEVTLTKGKANFKLHAILARESKQPGQPQAKKAKKGRSSQNTKLAYPLRVLSIRENENLVD